MPVIVLSSELQDRIDEYQTDQSKNFSDKDIEYLDAMVSGETWNLDTKSLETLMTMVENLPFSYAGKDALVAKLQDKIQKSQEDALADDNEGIIPEYTDEGPIVIPPTLTYENTPPFELLKEYERLHQNTDIDSMERCGAILQIAREKVDGAYITADDAPLLDVYYKIMRLDDPDYPVPEKELKKALAVYDQNHHLDEANITAEEWKQNYDYWTENITYSDMSEQLHSYEIFSSMDTDTRVECIDTIRDAVLTDLSIYSSDMNEEAQTIMSSKITEYINQMQQQLAEKANDWFTHLSPEEQSKYKDDFAQTMGTTPENLQNNPSDYKEQFGPYLLSKYIKQNPDESNKIIRRVNANYITTTDILQTRIATRTNAPALMKEHTNWYKKLKEKHPRSMAFAENAILSGLASAIPGGLMALSVYKLGETYSEFKEQYKKQFPDKPAKVKDIFRWIMKDSDRKNKMITRCALTLASAGFITGVFTAALRPVTSLSITALSGAHTYINKKIGIDAQKKELARLLQKYNNDFLPAKWKDDKKKLDTLVKSLDEPSKLSKFFRRKKHSVSFEEALLAIAPNADISTEDRENIEKLIKDIKAKRSQRKAAVLGVAAGAMSVLGIKFTKDWFSADPVADAPVDEGNAVPEASRVAPDATTEAPSPDVTTEEPSTDVPVVEESATHIFEGQENNSNLDFAVNATPTPTYHKLIEIGVLDEEKAKELMGGRSYIPSRVLKDYLQHEAQFTDEQQQQFNDFINDRDSRMAEFNADRAARIAAHHGDTSTHHHVSSASAHTSADHAVVSNTSAAGAEQAVPTNTSDANTGASRAAIESDQTGAQQPDIQQQVEEARDRVYRLTTKEGTQVNVSGQNALAAFGQYTQDNHLDPSQNKIQASLASDENHSVTDITAKGRKMTIETYDDKNHDGVGQRRERIHTTTIKQDGDVTSSITRGDLDGNSHRGDVQRVVAGNGSSSQYNYIRGEGRTLDVTDSQGNRIRYERINGQTIATSYDSQGNSTGTQAVQGNPGIKTLRRFWEKQIKDR